MTNKLSSTIRNCRLCGSARIRPFLDLGTQPAANSLRDSLDEKLPVFPLVLCRCAQCTTIQLTVTVKPELLFKQYVWVTGTSSTAKTYANDFYDESSRRIEAKSKFVVEVASNDGTFLSVFKNKGFRVLGVDPAKNIAKIANERGIVTWPDFFGNKLATAIMDKKGAADFVFARNVVPHAANVSDVVAGMKTCLGKTGVGAVEFHYAKAIVDGLHYDSIYHEHLFYYSLKSILYLLGLHGLVAFDVIESPISGGSLVLYFTQKNNPRGISKRLKNKIREEEKSGLADKKTWDRFARDCRSHKKMLVKLIRREKSRNRRLIGYGASARSSTLLNFCGINRSSLECIADQNPLKQGKWTAGTDIPIVSPQEAFLRKPDVVVLLAWNFKDEILALIKNTYRFKGRVIVPLPNDPQTEALVP